MTLLDISEKLERLAAKLPGPLRKAMLREITPIKDLFLRQRPPRLVLLGSRTVPKDQFINGLFGSEVALIDPTDAGAGSWQRFSLAGKGTLQCLDARNPTALTRTKSALASEQPDLAIFIKNQGEDLSPDAVEGADALFQFNTERTDLPLPVIGVVVIGDSETEVGSIAEESNLNSWLRSQFHLQRGLTRTLSIQTKSLEQKDQSIRSLDWEALAEAITLFLPDDAKLEMARLSGVHSAQIHIAKVLTRSFAAISGAIGAQPIPLADFPILTSLQATMVAGIMYVSGREVTMKLAAEFIAALGANISAGLVLREGARALLKLFPGWGNAISGAIASAGTYAVGRAASAYFIEGASLPAARNLFLRRKSAIEKNPEGR